MWPRWRVCRCVLDTQTHNTGQLVKWVNSTRHIHTLRAIRLADWNLTALLTQIISYRTFKVTDYFEKKYISVEVRFKYDIWKINCKGLISKYIKKSYGPIGPFTVNTGDSKSSAIGSTNEPEHNTAILSPVTSMTEQLHMTRWVCSLTDGWTAHRHNWSCTIQPPHDTTPVYGPFSGTTRVSWCQKRTSGLYGARGD